MDEPPSSPDDIFGLVYSTGGLLLGSGGTQVSGLNGGWLLPAIIALFLLSFLFSGMEAAFFSFGRYRLRELRANGHAGAQKLAILFQKPGRLVSILVILNITVNVILTSLWTGGAINIADTTGVSPTKFIVGAEVLLLFLIVLFSEITPKAVFTKYAESLTLAFLPLMLFLNRVVGPIGAILEGIAKVLLFPLGGNEKDKSHSVTEEEIINIVSVGESEGVLDEREKEMIHSIFEFGDRQVKEVMVPRTDVVAVEVNMSLRDAMREIMASGFSRIPVYEQSIDSIVGILMAKDILPLIAHGGIETTTVMELKRGQVYFIPETKPVDELFTEFQKEKISMAVAVDEHGGTAGVITTEDMLEEIVGEITDEYDKEGALIEEQPDGSYIMEGRTGLYELEEMFNIDLEDEDYDTVGGLVLAKLGSIPEPGRTVDDSNLRFEVLEVEGNRLTKLRVRRIFSRPEEDSYE